MLLGSPKKKTDFGRPERSLFIFRKGIDMKKKPRYTVSCCGRLLYEWRRLSLKRFCLMTDDDEKRRIGWVCPRCGKPLEIIDSTLGYEGVPW